MPAGRGRKAKKAGWQVVLGLKQVLFGALGLAWMMIIIFILGVLAGRGDIYRLFSSWGLLSPQAPKTAQWSPPPAPGVNAPPAATPAKSLQAAPPPAAPASPASSVVTGSLTASPAPAASPPTSAAQAKKTKKKSSPWDQKAKDEELRRLRQEVASILKFQNSRDTTPTKPGKPASKKKEKHLAAAPKAPPKKVRAAQFRDLKAAKAKMAELQKKGEKVTLRQGKDKKGTFYEVLREAPADGREDANLAQKNQKPGGNKPKGRSE